MSHALLETWRRRRGNTLTLAGFQAAGGIDGALARTAESLYTSLRLPQQRLAKDLFLRLTALGEGTEDTKRRIVRSELGIADPDTAVVLERLACERLLTLDRDSVEITHEALIRCWPRLHDWLTEDREGLRIHRQLTEAAQAWESLDHDPDSLYRGTRLALARDWSAGHPGALNPQEQEFLDASLSAEARDQATARRRTRRLRQLVVMLTVLLVVATTSTIYAISAERVASEQRNLALAQKVAGQAIGLRATNPALAAQLSLAAYRLVPTADARSSLLSAFATPYATRVTGHRASINAVAFGIDGHILATAGDDRAVRLWEADPERVATRVCDLTDPKITHAEWHQYFPGLPYQPPCP